MDENKSGNSVGQTIKNAANAAKAAIAAAGKAAAGDVAGAVKDILTNPELLKAIVCVIAILSLIIVAPFMLIGAILTAVLNCLAENWDENWTDAAIDSNGSRWQYYSSAPIVGLETLFDSGVDFVNWLFEEEQEGEDAGMTGEDLQKTVDAVKETESLVGDDGALWKRINMIKGRVKRRGEQMNDAVDLYQVQGFVCEAVEFLAAAAENPFLFNGYTTSMNINTEVFELTDIQALKIYAAYAVQHDCSLADADINDLIDYCGWYNPVGWSSVQDDEYSIYNTSETVTVNDNLYEMSPGAEDDVAFLVSSRSYDLLDIYVPTWEGTCAPQWFYEELAQIEESNDKVIAAVGEENADDLAELAILSKVTTNDTPLYLNPKSSFEKLNDCQPFGLIDKLYTSTAARVTVTRTEYEDPNMSAFEQAAAGIWGDLVASWWNDAYGGKSGRSDENRGTVHRAMISGEHWFQLDAPTPNKYYYLTLDNGTVQTSVKYAPLKANLNNNTEDGRSTEGGYSYTEGSADPIIFGSLLPSTNYVLYESDDDEVDNDDTQIDTFTTFVEESDYLAFSIDVSVTVDFSSISVDQLLYDTLGLWPGDLNNTMEKDGKLYATGYTNNENMVRYWEDTYTDADGNTKVVQFERLSGFQVEAYEDTVRMLAAEDVMNIPIANMFGTYNQNYGSDIVAMARQEYEYYTQSGLYEGARYWNMAYEAGGTSYLLDGSTAWCVVFVETCAWQCGYIGEGKAWGDMMTSNGWPLNCSGIRNKLVNDQNGIFYESEYKPVPGDLIFFGSTSSFSTVQHIGIVTESRPDNTIQVIHGNYSNKVSLNELGNYALGTPLNGSQVICGYVHPNYPPKIFDEPVYLSQGDQVRPDTSARYVVTTVTPESGNPYEVSVLLAGKGRFRKEQLATVNLALEQYPELDCSELKAAISSGNSDAIIEAWNNLSSSAMKSQFETAQEEILTTYFVKPVAEAVQKETGFNWMKTEVRQNLLLAIVTTSSNSPALKNVLKTLCNGMSDDYSDGAFLQAMNENNNKTTILYDTLMASASSLWPNDPAEMQKWWALSVQRTLEKMQELWNASGAQYGDPSSSVQDQIYYYLTYSMGLSPAAACGILANVEAECSFDLATVGDSGTAFGICQWRHGRWDGCVAYCAELGLDPNTVQGQVEWLRRELEKSYPKVLEHLRSVPNTAEGAASAADYFCRYYEIPSNLDAKAQARASRAQSYFWPQYGR